MDKQVRQLIRAVEANGYTVAQNGRGGHMKIRDPQGATVLAENGAPLMIPSTPGDGRWYANNVANLTRAGVLQGRARVAHRRRTMPMNDAHADLRARVAEALSAWSGTTAFAVDVIAFARERGLKFSTKSPTPGTVAMHKATSSLAVSVNTFVNGTRTKPPGGVSSWMATLLTSFLDWLEDGAAVVEPEPEPEPEPAPPPALSAEDRVEPDVIRRARDAARAVFREAGIIDPHLVEAGVRSTSTVDTTPTPTGVRITVTIDVDVQPKEARP